MDTETPDMAEAEGEWEPCEHPGDDCGDDCECECEECEECYQAREQEDREIEIEEEIEEMTSALLTLGIGRTAAAEYAAQLFEEGYDTPESLHDISEKEMQELDFKKPHIRKIIES